MCSTHLYKRRVISTLPTCVLVLVGVCYRTILLLFMRRGTSACDSNVIVAIRQRCVTHWNSDKFASALRTGYITYLLLRVRKNILFLFFSERDRFRLHIFISIRPLYRFHSTKTYRTIFPNFRIEGECRWTPNTPLTHAPGSKRIMYRHNCTRALDQVQFSAISFPVGIHGAQWVRTETNGC